MNRAPDKYEKALTRAVNYEDWYAAALELDRLDGLDQWREERESEEYDHRLIASRVRLLRKLRRQEDIDLLGAVRFYGYAREDQGSQMDSFPRIRAPPRRVRVVLDGVGGERHLKAAPEVGLCRALAQALIQ